MFDDKGHACLVFRPFSITYEKVLISRINHMSVFLFLNSLPPKELCIYVVNIDTYI